MKVILRNFNCTREHVPVEAMDAIQSIFNGSGDFANSAFGHPCSGGEAVEFLRLQFRPATAVVNIYEVIHEDHIAKSVGIVATQFAPEIRQSIFSLFLLDSQHRGMGIGKLALTLAESELHPDSQFVSAVVSQSQPKALKFWASCGYQPEATLPMSMDPRFFHQDANYVRLVKETGPAPLLH